ncbi:unnamed protein product [Tenebrio molitor]|nr:unnamed protein product [Tenebrio molitor]
MFVILLGVFIILKLDCVDNVIAAPHSKKSICAKLSVSTLENVLGGAFNSRYMSVDVPTTDVPTNGKRGVSVDEDFFVQEDFVEQLDTEPAWKLQNHVEAAKRKHMSRRSERGVDLVEQWQCKSKIEWVDLGPDYFPRYLRKVVCQNQNCWFGLFRCKAKAFNVKLLRRKKEYCTNGEGNNTKVGFVGLPKELTELWVWEERAVTFCCECGKV